MVEFKLVMNDLDFMVKNGSIGALISEYERLGAACGSHRWQGTESPDNKDIQAWRDCLYKAILQKAVVLKNDLQDVANQKWAHIIPVPEEFK